MPKQKLSGKDRAAFKATRLWWDSGGCADALVQAIEKANFYMANHMRQGARRAVMGNRNDSNPFKQNVLSRSTGQFNKNTVARPFGKPPRFYKRNSLNQIHMAPSDNVVTVQVQGHGVNNRTVSARTWLVGPIRGGEVTGLMIGSVTTPRKLEFGGAQVRYFRKVPAIKQRGKRAATWDGDWRWEFSNKPIPSTPGERRMWYFHLQQAGIIPAAQWVGLMSPEFDIPWTKSMFSQVERRYMRKAFYSAVRKRRSFLVAARKEFPKLAQKFIKIGKGGYKV